VQPPAGNVHSAKDACRGARGDGDFQREVNDEEEDGAVFSQISTLFVMPQFEHLGLLGIYLMILKNAFFENNVRTGSIFILNSA
jgi:phosphopantetheine adenylyltransferase